MTSPRSDGRRARGDATRQKVARTAADIATRDGLDSITIGQLATVTGVSKSGILTVFPDREAIQLAAVATAREVYIDAVIRPALAATAGAPRLRGLVEAWVAYLKADTFPGGCFLAAASVEFGHRRGPVAEAVRDLKRAWLDVLERELAAAGHADPVESAFRLDAYLEAGNNRRGMFWDDAELDRARDLALSLIG